MKTLPYLLFYLTTFFAGDQLMAQKENKYKSAEWWKREYEMREKNAPKEAQEKLVTLRKQGEMEKWGFEIGYTGVFNKDLASITGFRTPTEDYIKANPERIIPAEKFSNLPAQSNFKNTILSPSIPFFDGYSLGIVTPAKDQHRCGSCWAFAAMGAFETSYLLRNGGVPESLDLSEQQVLDCSIPFGCIGEFTSTGLEYIASHFIQTESVYPYTGSSIPCNNLGRSMYAGRSWGWVGGSLLAATAPDVIGIKQAICDHGSVISAFYASPLFQMFRGDGVYDHDDHGVASNHVVQIIGWDDSRSAWLIKNSWGADGWGLNGMGWVSYDLNHIGAYSCWIDAATPQPVVTPTAILTPFINTSFDFIRNLPANDIYKITNVQNNKMVEVKDGCDLFDKGLKVQQYVDHGIVPCCDGKNQEWLFIPAGEVAGQKVFYIINNGFTRTLEPGINPTVQNTSTIDTRWFIQPVGDVFYFRSVTNNLYLEVMDGNSNDGEWMKMSSFTGRINQQFRLTKLVGFTGPQNYTPGSFVSINSQLDNNKTLNITDAADVNGTGIQLYDLEAGSRNEHWQLVRNTTGYYKIQSRLAPGKTIDITGWEGGNNSNLLLWDNAGVDKQEWLIIPVAREAGSYIFFNKVSGRCMDIAGGRSENHAAIQTYLFANAANQKWKIMPVNQ